MRVDWKRQLARSRNQGRNDGRARLPAKDQPHISPPAERQLAARCEQEIQEIVARRLQDDRRLKNIYCQVLEREKVAIHLLSTHEELAEKLRGAHMRNVERLQAELVNQNKSANILGGIGEAIYFLGIGVFIGVFLRVAAVALGSNQFGSLAGYLLAAPVVGAVLVGGHYLGVLLNVRDPDSVQRIVGITGAITPVVATAGLAYLSGRPGDILLAGILGFLVISVLSYLANNQRAVQMRMTAKPLARAERRLRGVQRQVNRIRDRLQRLVATRELTRETALVRARQKVSEFKELVNAYRTGNLEAWPDRGIPEAFTTDFDVTLPEVLRTLNWQCSSPTEP